MHSDVLRHADGDLKSLTFWSLYSNSYQPCCFVYRNATDVTINTCEMLQADGTLTRNSQSLESPAKSSLSANQSAFYNAPVSNGSSVTPQKRKTNAAASVNAKKMFDEV